MLFRLACGIVIVGIALIVHGFREMRLGSQASTKAVDVDLRSLEEGKTPSGTHLRVGKHVALYTESVFQYTIRSGSRAQPGLNTPVNYVYYPIVSAGRSGENNGDPQSFAVLVKTYKYPTAGSIPNGDFSEASLQGMAINRINSLGKEERDLLYGSFPKTNFQSVIILEAGRKPTSAGAAVAIMAGGGATILLGVFFAFSVMSGGGERPSTRERYGLDSRGSSSGGSSSAEAGNFAFLEQPQAAAQAPAYAAAGYAAAGYAAPGYAAQAHTPPVSMPPGSLPPVIRPSAAPSPMMVPAVAPVPVSAPAAVACPHCGMSVVGNPQLRGMAVACPQCMQPFIMP